MKLSIAFVTALLLACSICAPQVVSQTYRCKPCHLACDSLLFQAPGNCPHCSMPLLNQEGLRQEAYFKGNNVQIKPGSGVFLIEGGKGKEEKTISVYYHQPQDFSVHSPILLVIPGSGRNADEYRDAWVEAAENWGVLILSPMYAKEAYGFGDYHMGGTLKEMNMKDCVNYHENSNVVELDESCFRYQVNDDLAEWLYHDFDRIFELAVKATGSKQTGYDLFGHSAGGQILHRFALLLPHSKANRIVAANAGFYTMPDFGLAPPFGLKDMPIDQDGLKKAFQKELVLLLGELDNAREQRGYLLRSPTADRQGIHRLERGKYFHSQGKLMAAALGAGFHWKLALVPQVGHEFRKMSEAAAYYLYGKGE